MSDLYVLYDIENNLPIEGPRLLPANLIDLSMEELNAIHWYLALPAEYDIGSAFDNNAFNVVSETCEFIEEPFPAVRRLKVTAPKDLETVQRYVVLQLTEFRNNLFNSGFIYGGYKFDANGESRTNWTASVTSMLGIAFLYGLNASTLDSVPGAQGWTRWDNKTALFTKTEVIQCGLRLGAWASDCYAYCRSLKDQVLSSDDFEFVWGTWVNNDISLWASNDLGGSLSLAQPPVDPE